MPLRKDVLNHLGLPVQVRVGYVGKVKFQIPVAKMRSEPWVISFEHVYLVAGPRDHNAVNIPIFHLAFTSHFPGNCSVSRVPISHTGPYAPNWVLCHRNGASTSFCSACFFFFGSLWQPYNEETEEARLQEQKMAALDALENEWKSERDPQQRGPMSSSFYSLTYSSWIGYGASLVTNIVQNLQVPSPNVNYIRIN